MSTPLKNGLRSGAITSIIVIFITIINFLQVISGMLGKLLGNSDQAAGLIPTINLIIILFIIGAILMSLLSGFGGNVYT